MSTGGFLRKESIDRYIDNLPRHEAEARNMASARGHGHRLRPIESLRLMLAKAIRSWEPTFNEPGQGKIRGKKALHDRGVYVRMSENAAREIWESGQLGGRFEDWLEGLEIIDLRTYREDGTPEPVDADAD